MYFVSVSPPRSIRKSKRRRDPGRLQLWPMGVVLPLSFAIALLALSGLAWISWIVLGSPRLPHPRPISLHDSISVLQLVFASVAGAGALMALVMAYRRQRVAEASSAHDRMRAFNERFISIATQLGDDQAAVRLAGVHAMAGLADDWEENRQTCIDVLCAYLRMPYTPDPGTSASAAERLAFGTNREVRHTMIRVITEHLQEDAAVPWQDLKFDFRGAVFDGGEFRLAKISSGTMDFTDAEFSDGYVWFRGIDISGGGINFRNAIFSGGVVDFSSANLSSAVFVHAKFSGGYVSFRWTNFSGRYNGKYIDSSFGGAKFSDGKVSFQDAKFTSGWTEFGGAAFSGCDVDFSDAEFTGGKVSFSGAEFSGGKVDFNGAEFSGGKVDFSGVEFSGGEIDLHSPRNWSRPPVFDDWGHKSPPGIQLP